MWGVGNFVQRNYYKNAATLNDSVNHNCICWIFFACGEAVSASMFPGGFLEENGVGTANVGY